MPVFKLLLSLFFILPLGVSAQGWMSSERSADGVANTFRIMSYNVENFFDVYDDSLHLDDDFLPEGSYKWTSQRFVVKAASLARTVLDAGGLGPVDVIGLCEVEGDSALHHLFHRTRLARLGYQYVVTDGDDVRGMNVAIAWQPASFSLIGHTAFSVPLPDVSQRPTRRILLCSGRTAGGDTLDVMMLHFPSRRGGHAADPLRQAAVKTVVRVCDSLQHCRRRPHIIVMGDCNATPTDRQLLPLRAAGLRYVPAEIPAGSPVGGTYLFRNNWSCIDQMWTCGEFRGMECQVFVRDYMLERNADGLPVPFRTYRGPSYHGGYSDHLPLVARFFLDF